MNEKEMRRRDINPMARRLQEVTPVYSGSYARFYGLLKLLPGDKEEIKRQLVLQYTSHRTDSLKEVTYNEYKRMCDRMQELVPSGAPSSMLAIREELRRQRSIALHQMQKMGVDTTDWGRVNALCQDVRIAGKEFRQLSTDELSALTTKLRMIERKGGFREPFGEPQGTEARIININNN